MSDADVQLIALLWGGIQLGAILVMVIDNSAIPVGIGWFVVFFVYLVFLYCKRDKL